MQSTVKKKLENGKPAIHLRKRNDLSELRTTSLFVFKCKTFSEIAMKWFKYNDCLGAHSSIKRTGSFKEIQGPESSILLCHIFASSSPFFSLYFVTVRMQ